MTIGVVAPGIAVVAGDTQHNCADGIQNLGERVKRVPGGWLAGTGNTNTVLLGLRMVEGIGLRNLDRVQQTIGEARASVLAASPRSNPERVSRCSFIAAREIEGNVFGLTAFHTDKDRESPPDTSDGRFHTLTSYPPGTTDAQNGEVREILTDRLRGAKTVGGIIRAVAAAMAATRQRGGDISDEIELGLSFAVRGGGYRRGHLRRPYAWVLAASDEAITAAVGDPPVYPPFPQSPAEQKYFKPREDALW